MDVEDKKYKIVKEELKAIVRRETKRLKRGREHPVKLRKERKSGGDEESSSTSKPSWSYEIVLPSEEDGPRGPAGHRLPPRPWTEDEDINFARFIASKRHLDAAAWSEYHASHPSRSIDAYYSHYHVKKEQIDRLVQRIKKKRPGQSQPSLLHSRSPSSSRPTSTFAPNYDSSDQEDGDADSNDEPFESSKQVARRSSFGRQNQYALRESRTGEPCRNCNLKKDKRWYRLLDIDDGTGQYCEGCRSAFRTRVRTSIAEGNAALARRRTKLVVPSLRGIFRSDVSAERNDNDVPFPPPPPPPPPPPQPRRFQREPSIPPPFFSAPASGSGPAFFPSLQHPGPSSSFTSSFMDRSWAPVPPSPPSNGTDPVPSLDGPLATMRRRDDAFGRGWDDARRRPPSPPFFTDAQMGPGSRFGNQFEMDLPGHGHRRSPSPPPAASGASIPSSGVGPSSFASGSSFFASTSNGMGMGTHRAGGPSRDQPMGQTFGGGSGRRE